MKDSSKELFFGITTVDSLYFSVILYIWMEVRLMTIHDVCNVAKHSILNRAFQIGIILFLCIVKTSDAIFSLCTLSQLLIIYYSNFSLFVFIVTN